MPNEDKLSEIFDVEPISKTEEVYPLPVSVQQTSISKLETKDSDLEYVRTNLYNLIQKGSGAIAGALAVANESQHPRAYEVAGNLIKNIADLTDKLVDLQKAKQALGPKEEIKTVNNIDKAVIFNGSTAELLKMLKNESNNS